MSAYLQSQPTVVAGTFATARLSLALPRAIALSGPRGVWELVDEGGRVWNRGDAVSLAVEPSQTASSQQILSAEVQVPVPANVPTNEAGSRYQIRWMLSDAGGWTSYAFDTILVVPETVQGSGSLDAMGLWGDAITTAIRLPRRYETVAAAVYQGNTRIINGAGATGIKEDSDGIVYELELPPGTFQAPSLDPYSVIWTYRDAGDSAPMQQEVSELFQVTPTMLVAVNEMQRWLNRAWTESGIQPGTTFSPTDYVGYLRTGRDAFNAAVKPTSFTMTNARDGLRWFWIGYSAVAAARAQYLAEGMKAFNYAGQTVQLDMDRSPYWEQLAAALESQLSEHVKPFKDLLAARGVLGGDGSSVAPNPKAAGILGISVHHASPFRGGQFLSGQTAPFIW